MMPKTTIVVPCYNEERRLPRDQFVSFLPEARAHCIQFLFVNDGSRDNTRQVLQEFEQAHPDTFRVLNLARNSGKAEAVRQGVLEALDDRAQFVGFWDADLATPLTAIPDFLRVLGREPHRSLCMGSRVMLLGRRIERRWKRHLLGRCFATCASLVLSLRVYDTQCGAKLFRVGPWTRTLFETPFRSRWIFDVELLARMSRCIGRFTGRPLADSVYELPLDEWRDIAGSKLRAGDFVRAIGELLTIWSENRRLRGQPAEPTILPMPQRPATTSANVDTPTSTRAA